MASWPVAALFVTMTATIAWFVRRRRNETKREQWIAALRAEIEQAGGIEGWKRAKIEALKRAKSAPDD